MKLPTLKIGDITVKVPIIQGAMGIGVSMSRLAAAVANEGGIGVISGAQTGLMEPDFRINNNSANINGLIKEIRKARELSPNGIIGVNFLTAAVNNYVELVTAAVKEKVDLIISGAGLPKNLPELVKNSTTKIAPIVSSGKAAATISKIWDRNYNYLPDAIIVEGPEAGGHLGFHMEELLENKSQHLLDILKDVLEAIKPFEAKYNRKIPVIAAGGIFSGKDIADALHSGASGVQIATRFVATDECDAHINFKKAYVEAKKEDLRIIKSPVGLPGRAIYNTFVEKAEKGLHKIKKCYRCLSTCDPQTTPYCITDALIDSVTGDTENGLVFAGSNVYRIDKITTVKELMKELISEAEQYYTGQSEPQNI